MAEKERKKRVRKEVFQAAADSAAGEAENAAAAPAAAARPETAGDVLRKAREEKGLTLQGASSAIHLRTSQIRAIEEGDMSQLPGMTYAVGFVRSYAKFLKLDSEEIVNRFKQENGAAGARKPELHFPAPLTEGKTPGPMIIGVSTVFVVALLALWAIFSGGGSDADKTGAETAAIETPADTSLVPGLAPATADAAAPVAVDDTAADGVAVTADAESPAAAAAENETATPADAAAATTATSAAPHDAAAPGSAATVPVTVPQSALAVANGVAAPTETPVVVAPAVSETAPLGSATPAPVPVKPAKPAPADDDAASDQIVVKQPKGRIVLQAVESSWVQITDASGKIILKKVMRTGEKFSPPDQPGLSLVTSNAGGLAITVDGTSVNPLGNSGDIVRGVSLDPQSLKNRRASRIRNY